jgi:hypothetical protein
LSMPISKHCHSLTLIRRSSKNRIGQKTGSQKSHSNHSQSFVNQSIEGQEIEKRKRTSVHSSSQQNRPKTFQQVPSGSGSGGGATSNQPTGRVVVGQSKMNHSIVNIVGGQAIHKHSGSTSVDRRHESRASEAGGSIHMKDASSGLHARGQMMAMQPREHSPPN